MHINACDATTGWKGFSLSITQLHNVSYHILPFLSVIVTNLKHNAQLVLSEVGGQGFSGAEA